MLNTILLASNGNRDLAWINNSRLLCFAPGIKDLDERLLTVWGQPNPPDLKPLWESVCKESIALALGPDSVAIARASELACLNLEDGKTLWSQPLPASPVPWGLAVDRNGRLIVPLENGQVLCFGQGGQLATSSASFE